MSIVKRIPKDIIKLTQNETIATFKGREQTRWNLSVFVTILLKLLGVLLIDQLYLKKQRTSTTVSLEKVVKRRSAFHLSLFNLHLTIKLNLNGVVTSVYVSPRQF